MSKQGRKILPQSLYCLLLPHCGIFLKIHKVNIDLETCLENQDGIGGLLLKVDIAFVNLNTNN